MHTSAHIVHMSARDHAHDATPRDHGLGGSAAGNATRGAMAAKKINMKINRRWPGVGPKEKPRSSTAGVKEMTTSATKILSRCLAHTDRSATAYRAKKTGVAMRSNVGGNRRPRNWSTEGADALGRPC
jgi:hypothetical protein